MKFEHFLEACDAEVRTNPAGALAKHIFSHSKELTLIRIEVHKIGGPYTPHSGFTVTPDEESDDAERRKSARELAESIVEICADAQSAYEKAVDWRITGVQETPNGKDQTLFSERFKVEPSAGQALKKQSESDVITASNILLRDIAADNHKNVMRLAEVLIRMVTPVSAMAGNIAEKIRPSDAEINHKTRMAELELDAAVKQAQASNRRARNDGVKDLLKGLFDDLPLQDLGEAAKMIAKMQLEREQERSRQAERDAEREREKRDRERTSTVDGPDDDGDATPPQETATRAAAAELTAEKTTSKKKTSKRTTSKKKTAKKISRAPSKPTKSKEAPIVHPTTVVSDPPTLCESSATFADILGDRAEAVAQVLGDEDWSSVRALAEQHDEEAFAEQASALHEQFQAKPKLAQTALFAKLCQAIGSEERVERLHAFFKKSGVFG